MVTKKQVCIHLILYSGIIIAITALAPFIFSQLSFSSSFLRFLVKGIPYILFIICTLFFNMILEKKSWKELGFSKRKIFFQCLIGFVVGTITVVMYIGIPFLAGLPINSLVGGPPDNLFFEILRYFLFVGFGEELIFRGFLQSRLEFLLSSNWAALIISSFLFGLWHFINGRNFLQVGITAIMGFIYGMCRLKIKNCTTVSVSIAHGLHDSTLSLISYLV